MEIYTISDDVIKSDGKETLKTKKDVKKNNSERLDKQLFLLGPFIILLQLSKMLCLMQVDLFLACILHIFFYLNYYL